MGEQLTYEELEMLAKVVTAENRDLKAEVERLRDAAQAVVDDAASYYEGHLRVAADKVDALEAALESK